MRMIEERTQVAEYGRRMSAAGLSTGTSGNISVCDPQLGLMAISPSGMDYDSITPEDVVLMNLEGRIADGQRTPSSEWGLHAAFYRRKPHVRAVVHTHSPYATSFAVNQQEVPVVLIEMIPFLKGKLEVSPYARQGSAQVGLNAVPILKRKNACLLANHGVVAVGEDMEAAYLNSVYVEDTARIYHLALCCGKPRVIPGYEEGGDV